MNFNAVKARLNGATYGFTELADHCTDVFTTQCDWRGCSVTRRGNSAWPHRRAPANQFRVNHTAAMVDLQQRSGTFRLNGISNFCQPGDFLVVINADCAGESQP
ncbi:hypothetical protein D3C80_1028310 [compost metagenome]